MGGRWEERGGYHLLFFFALPCYLGFGAFCFFHLTFEGLLFTVQFFNGCDFDVFSTRKEQTGSGDGLEMEIWRETHMI